MNINYTKLDFDGKRWSEEAIELIKNTLEVWDDNHRIIICHPNKVFFEKLVTKEEKEVTNIDWDDINPYFEVEEDDCFINYWPDATKSFNYLYKRFNHELFNKKDKEDSPKYLVVIEQDEKENTLVRALFKATKKDLSVVVNPEYELYRPKNNFEKIIRFNEASNSENNIRFQDINEYKKCLKKIKKM